MIQFEQIGFTLPSIALAAAGDGRDAIALRQLSHAWHACLREHVRQGLLQDVRVKLNIDAFLAALPSTHGDGGDVYSDDEFDSVPGRPRPEVTLRQPGQSGEVISVSFSPSGTQVALVAVDRQIRTFDVSNGAQILALCGHAGLVQRVCYSPSGDRLLSACLDSTARIWNANTGIHEVSIRSLTGSIFDAVFSPCAKIVLTTSFGGPVTLWDATSGIELVQMLGHSGVVFSGEFSEDGAQILTTSKDGSVRLWSGTGVELKVFGLEGTGCRTASFSSRCPPTILAVGQNGTLVHWDCNSGEEIDRWTGFHIVGASFDPESTKIIACCRDYKVWLLSVGIALSTEKGTAQMLMESETYELQAATFSPCGRFVLTGSGGVTGTVRIWDARSLNLICAFEVTPGVISGIDHVGFSPCGSRVLASCYNGAVRLWGRTPAF